MQLAFAEVVFLVCLGPGLHSCFPHICLGNLNFSLLDSLFSGTAEGKYSSLHFLGERAAVQMGHGVRGSGSRCVISLSVGSKPGEDSCARDEGI